AALTAQGITPTVAGICAATNPTKLGNANMSGDGPCTSGLNTYGYPCKPGGGVRACGLVGLRVLGLRAGRHLGAGVRRSPVTG
ncbi:MAG: hypothetical protein ACKOWF_00035, partial [Chloroflexota bacterium]